MAAVHVFSAVTGVIGFRLCGLYRLELRACCVLSAKVQQMFNSNFGGIRVQRVGFVTPEPVNAKVISEGEALEQLHPLGALRCPPCLHGAGLLLAEGGI